MWTDKATARALLVAALAHSAAAVVTPNIFFNLTLASHSTIFDYRAYGGTDREYKGIIYPGGAAAWWNTTFEGANGAVGTGKSTHVGNFRRNTGSNVDFSTGTVYMEQTELLAKAVYVYGSVEGLNTSAGSSSSSNPDFEFDRTSVSNVPLGGGMIGVQTYTTFDYQRFSMTLRDAYVNSGNPPPLRITVSDVIVTVGMKTQASSLATTPSLTVPFVLDGKPNPIFSFSGKWEPLGELPSMLIGREGPSTSPYSSYPVSPRVSVSIPRNTAFVLVMGGTHPESGTYSISVSPKSSSGYVSSPIKGILQGPENELWITEGATLFYAALDPNEEYTMTISSSKGLQDVAWAGPGPQRLGSLLLQNVTFWSGTDQTPTPVTTYAPAATSGYSGGGGGGGGGGSSGGKIWPWENGGVPPNRPGLKIDMQGAGIGGSPSPTTGGLNGGVPMAMNRAQRVVGSGWLSLAATMIAYVVGT